MANFVRITTRIEYSENSDYSSPIHDETLVQEDTTPTYCELKKRVQVGTGGLTIDMGNMTADADDVIIHNHSSTAAEIVQVDFENDVNAGVESVDVEPGKTRMIGLAEKASDLVLTSDSGTPEVTVIFLGPAS